MVKIGKQDGTNERKAPFWGKTGVRRKIVYNAGGFAAVGSGGEIFELYMRSSVYQYVYR